MIGGNSKKMKPTQQLPDGYQQNGIIDLIRNQKILVVINIVGVLLFLLFGWLFVEYFRLVRPDDLDRMQSFKIESISSVINVFFALIFTLFAMVVVHEGAHGIFFWIFTRSRPRYAFKGFYAYATAPGWYLPKKQYMIIAVAPFLLITLCGIVLTYFITYSLLIPLLFLLTLNASGSVGDLFVFVWLIGKPEKSLALDEGERIIVYLPTQR